MIIDVPEEHRREFELDIHTALRDVAGIANSVFHPFISDKHAISEVFDKVQSVLSREFSDFCASKLRFFPKRFRLLDQPRFVHIDLAVSADSTGIACGYVSSFVRMKRGEDVYEILPRIVFDFILEVPPPQGGEINFAKIRSSLYKLRDYGLPIEWATLDSYQSTDTQQLLRQKGFCTGTQSTVKDPRPDDFLKTAILERRVYLPSHRKAQRELTLLERDQRTGKVDHPPRGSKDIADAIACVVFGLTRMRKVWWNHKIPPDKIPKNVLRALNFVSETRN